VLVIDLFECLSLCLAVWLSLSLSVSLCVSSMGRNPHLEPHTSHGQAVRHGDLLEFEKTVAANAALFKADKTYTLILRYVSHPRHKGTDVNQSVGSGWMHVCVSIADTAAPRRSANTGWATT
jgi:hypothetical protein